MLESIYEINIKWLLIHYHVFQLAKWNHGPAVIRLMLYTAEDNINQRKRHVHELSGKQCCKETGICEVVVDEKVDYTAV